MLILRDIGLGLTRFEQLRGNLGIAPNILARRLKGLSDAGLLERVCYCARPPREEYRLTASGRDFLPVLHAIGAWGRRHNGAGELACTLDAETGLPIEPEVIDRVSGAPIGSRALRMVLADDGSALSPAHLRTPQCQHT